MSVLTSPTSQSPFDSLTAFSACRLNCRQFEFYKDESVCRDCWRLAWLVVFESECNRGGVR